MKSYDQLTKELNTYQEQLAVANNSYTVSTYARQAINPSTYYYNVVLEVKHRTNILGFTGSPYYTQETQSRFNNDLYNHHILQANHVVTAAYQRISQIHSAITNIQSDINKLNALITDGNDLYNKQQYNEAIAKFDEALKYNVQPVISHTNKSWAYNALKQYDQAIEACDQALAIDSGYVQAKENKARALIWQSYELYYEGKYSEAIVKSDEALEYSNKIEAHTNKAAAYVALKQYDKAIEACDNALAIDAEYALAKGNKAWALSSQSYEKSLVETELEKSKTEVKNDVSDEKIIDSNESDKATSNEDTKITTDNESSKSIICFKNSILSDTELGISSSAAQFNSMNLLGNDIETNLNS